MRRSLLFTSLIVATAMKSGPLQVYLLAGQSNMEGQAPIGNLAKPRNGTLAYMVLNETRASVRAWADHIFDRATQTWAVKDDVLMFGDEYDPGNWSVGFGANKNAIGPEFGLGYTLSARSPHQVLLAKAAWGGTSLAGDWRPPSSGGTVGHLFNASVGLWKSLLTPEGLAAAFPWYNAKEGFEIAGAVWVQGWQDGCVEAWAEDYERNLANLISDMRIAMNAPKMPWAIPVFGVAGFGQTEGRRKAVTRAAFNVANCTLHPELGCGSVMALETRDLWRSFSETGGAINQGYHYFGNAETYWGMGERAGLALASQRGW